MIFAPLGRLGLGQWLRLGTILCLCCYAGSSWAAERYIEGEHYKRLPIAVATQNAELPEVVELFSYLCIHCYHFDPLLEQWVTEQGDRIAFRRVPAVFTETWKLMAQAFFAAQALDVGAQMHGPLFRAIHEQHLNLGDPAIMADLFKREAGVDPERFSDVFDSFGVRSKVQWADGQSRVYRVSGVPSLVVDGKYLVDGTMAGSNDNMLAVVEFLLNKERNATGDHGAAVTATTAADAPSDAAADDY